ncbi:MAG: SCO family protein [Betaproteobacteria bacterium]|nr:SCO family protein [Betaproteobacteria bacterium]
MSLPISIDPAMRVVYRIAAVALALAVIAAVAWPHVTVERAPRSARLPVMTEVGGDFELMGAGGARVHLHDYHGRAVLLFFGYMHCPDVCPTGLYTLKGVLDELGEAAGRVQVIMVTVDPERDTPEALER